tara:strand:- start:42 stop:578 length:537 start_codon:yes stop_codon:yes gene_type:complete
MADIVLEEIKEFIRGKYEIKASITGDLCIIEFPQRIQVPAFRGFRNCYEIEYADSMSKIKYTRWSDKNKALRDISYNLPNYASKMFIWCDMVRCTLALGYSYELIRYDIDGADANEESFFKCVPTPVHDSDFEEKQEKLETLFLESYDKVYSDFEDEAEEDGVGDGFRSLCSIFLENR